jgi:DNA-binding transcriptional LysR family regulator
VIPPRVITLKARAGPMTGGDYPSTFDLTQLRCFVAVAEELHFGRAAILLNMTQPPLSRQIQILERILDARLLERTSRLVRLTPAGRNFLPDARRILRLASSAASTAKRIADGKTGAIRLGFTAASTYAFLPDLVTAILRRLPDIDLTLKEMVSGDQLDGLNSDQIDIGLLRPPFLRPGFETLRVMSEDLLAALPANHPLAAQTVLSLQDFHDQPFVMYAPYEARYFHNLLADIFARAGIRPRFVQHLTQIHTILALVGTGLGLSLVPASAARLHFDAVVLRPLQSGVAGVTELYLGWKGDTDNPLLPIVAGIARDMAGPIPDAHHPIV